MEENWKNIKAYSKLNLYNSQFKQIKKRKT